MTELAGALEQTALAQFLKASRWVYPGVNAGHILGVALLVGAVVSLDLRLLGALRGPDRLAAAPLLRPVAAAGLAIAVACGALLFVTQATDYVQSGWFRAKMAVLSLALLNVVLHPSLSRLRPRRRAIVALVSLSLWPSVLVLGRLVAYG